MSRVISAVRVATLVGDFDRSPAYAGLAEALRGLIGDGRIPYGTRLPSERDLTVALRISRTTVTRAYADLCERGYAESRRGSGTYTRLPGGRARQLDRVLTPRGGRPDQIDLNCAAPSSPPGLAPAYEAAVAELPSYLTGHGYFPAGLPELQQAVAGWYAARGLPTDPEQVMVTPGALAAAAVVAHACTGPGDRVLVETPGYPNAVRTFARRATRIVGTPVDVAGWDLDGLLATLRQTSPRVALLVPDFQNPTGNLMPEDERSSLAAMLSAGRALAVVDEAHQPLGLDGGRMPRPLAAHVEEAGGEAISLGSASKAFWGGLRLGWLRAPRSRMNALTEARLALDLGAPVLEQLVLTRLLADPGALLRAQRDRIREQRDRLVAALHRQLPDWEFRLPAGGLSLWCRLPAPLAAPLCAEAESRGVVVAAGPTFATDGGLGAFVRVPYTRPAEELEEAAARLADAWAAVRDGQHPRSPRGRVLVA